MFLEQQIIVQEVLKLREKVNIYLINILGSPLRFEKLEVSSQTPKRSSNISSPQVFKEKRPKRRSKKNVVIKLDIKEEEKFTNKNLLKMEIKPYEKASSQHKTTSKKSETEFICTNNIDGSHSKQEEVTNYDLHKYYSSEDVDEKITKPSKSINF